ncbi:MAG: hypothetical protein JNL79_20015 [Myxococcales bacterium]|nr:hypothetical protein [Myxococcales bacterium]
MKPLLFGLLLAGTASGCVGYGSFHGHHHHGPGVGDLLVVGGILAVSAIANAADEPPPPDPPPATGPIVVATPGAFDKGAAKKALAAVPYKDCGQGGEATVVLVFSSNGKVKQAGFADGALPPEVGACVLARFQGVEVPPFVKDTQTVSWRISLPQPIAAPAPTAKPLDM